MYRPYDWMGEDVGVSTANPTGVTQVWRALWAAGPERVALVDEASGRSWRRRELDDVTARAAAHLLGRGIAAGDAVILSVAPSDVAAVSFIALLRLGAVVVPVNTAATPREIEHICALSGARLALSDSLERFEGLVPAVAAESLLAPIDPVVAELLDLSEESARALICFTSGTTGAPKGAPLTHANLLAGTRALQQCWNWTPSDVLVSALPMFHVHGLLVALAGTLTSGATIVIHSRFDADRLIDSVRQHHATLVFGVPTMWMRLADSGRLGELATLRLAVSGSAPLSPALFSRLADQLGMAPVERYGMTETLILTSTPVDGVRRAGTVGRPLPGMSVRVADDGVVEVRGESVFGGYITSRADEPLLQDGFTDDGWFRTGDIGQWDGDDLRLIGRSSELIITGGYNVYPREVEDVLRADPRIVDVAVVGIPDDVWGESVVAFVVMGPAALGDDATIAAWKALAESELAPYKRPRSWTIVDELPRNAMGKVMRDDLSARGRGPESPG
ncbi:unannotated protein [freshwater metagenome]|uniref:Unannotated protein n=1 Tax=freshwater metagenome TaxID=449393 RepID=A0A6J7JAI7_9ZZZZ